MTVASGAALGFDVGGTNIRWLAIDHADAISAEGEQPRPEEADALVDALVSISSRFDGPVGSVGVGCAGLVDARGTVRTSPNISSLVDYPLGRFLAARIGLAIAVDNDATAAAWAEAATGAARERSHVLYISLGTGIGAGLVLDGSIYRGASGFAGEVGHMVVHPGGRACPCGRRGCWERYASGSALGHLARDAVDAGGAATILDLAGGDASSVRGEHVTAALDAGDADAGLIFDELAAELAVGIANLVNTLDPDTVVVGGGLSEVGAPLLERIVAAYPATMPDIAVRPAPDIVLASHGERAGALGAALLSRASPLS